MLLKLYQSRQQPSTIFNKKVNADYFRKLFSLSDLAFSSRRRRSSYIISNWDFFSSLFWHSSRCERPQLETVALDMPYSATWLVFERPSRMCARTQFRLIFKPGAFLLCWHYNLSDKGAANSLYHYKDSTAPNQGLPAEIKSCLIKLIPAFFIFLQSSAKDPKLKAS